MKLLDYTVLLVFLLLSACQQQPAETGQHQPVTTTAAVEAPAKAAPTLAERLSPIISGYWISARYLDRVAQTRSPRLAIANFPNVPATILVEPAPATADSTHASLVLNMHEGDEMTILFKTGHSASSLPVRLLNTEPTNSYEVAYQLSATDTILYLVLILENHL